ncbi:MAG: cytochrome c [Nitrospira sp.]|nr:cytochrome c [Nitrospira sp.]
MTTLANLPSTVYRRSTLRCLVTGIIYAAAICATVPMEAALAQNLKTPALTTAVEGDAAAGKILFDQHCVTCHGPKGRGDGLEIAGATVADLSSPTTQRKLNADLLATIHEGRPGKVMPSWHYRLSPEQSRDVPTYIRTLKRK